MNKNFIFIFRDGGRSNEQKARVEVYTIDSAQGLENDIVIMSVVKTRGVGFLANPQRLNVALTRAKKALYICGNFSSLRVSILMQLSSLLIYNSYILLSLLE